MLEKELTRLQEEKGKLSPLDENSKITAPTGHNATLSVRAFTEDGKEVKVKYRDVHARTLTNEVQYFPPKERVY